MQQPHRRGAMAENINYEYYRIFYYVAKYGNITRAAAALQSNQPNVTRVMKLLEHSLGCPLLVRSQKGVTLTQEGERLYEHVALAVEHLKKGEEELNGFAGLQRGSIAIGVTETALHLLVLEQLGRFKSEYPNVNIKIYNYSTLQALGALRNGQIDFAVVTGPVPKQRGFSEVILKEFCDVLIGGSSFREYAKEGRSLREIAEQPLVGLARGTVTYEYFNQLFLRNGLVYELDIEVAMADLILPTVAYQLGIGFLPESLARNALEKEQVVEIPVIEAVPKRTVSLVCDMDRGLGVAASRFKQQLSEYADR